MNRDAIGWTQVNTWHAWLAALLHAAKVFGLYLFQTTDSQQCQFRIVQVTC